MGAAQSTTSSALIAPMITTTATLGSVIPTVVTTLQNTETAIPTTLITKAISSSISSLAPAYTSVALPKATSPPKYLFVYGDSYTSSGFSIAGTKPAIGNPLGNPSYPGSTSTGAGQPNWLDLLTTNAPGNTLTYNLAVGGASVDNSLTAGVYADTPAFFNQTAIFLSNLKSKPSYCQWTATNSAHVIWFGRNDIFWMVSQQANMETRLNAVIASYINIVSSLWQAGARQFVVLSAPPMQREPVWSSTMPNLAANGTASNVFAPQIPPAVAYWNTKLQASLTAWQKGKPAVKIGYLDTTNAYSRVLDQPQVWGDTSGSCRNDDPALAGTAHRCPFADMVHPGPDLAMSIAITTGRYLASTGFLSGFALSYNAA